jgi:small subunit ribosomal protein S20
VPNIKSAKKRVEVTERNRKRNQMYKSAIRTSIKRVVESIRQSAESAEITTRLSKAYSLIDKAILKGVLHKNTGARYKSRLSLAINKHSAA